MVTDVCVDRVGAVVSLKPKLPAWHILGILYTCKYLISDLYMFEIYVHTKYLAITQYYFSRRKKPVYLIHTTSMVGTYSLSLSL